MLDEAQDFMGKIREQGRKRAKKFYETNKDEVNAKRRETYRLGRLALKGVVPPPPPPPPAPPVVEEVVNIPKIVDKPTFIIDNKPTLDFSKAKTLSVEEAMEYLKKVIPADKKNTLLKYQEDINRLVNMTGNKNIINILKNPKKTLKSINNAKMANGSPYSNNTIKGVLQTCLLLIDRFNISADKKEFINDFQVSKIQSSDDNSKKADEEPIYKFDKYLEIVKNKFGDMSKMYVLSKLYNELTVRDDFVLKIVDKKSEASDPDENYIIMGKNKILRIIINKYKTFDKYGVIDEQLSAGLSKLIHQYATNNSLKKGDYLFGNKKLTQFVHDNNAKIGVKGGVGEFRHMKISEELAKIISPEERILLATKMRHSPISQLWYVRKHFKD